MDETIYFEESISLRKFLVHDGIHDSGCSLKAYRAECFRGLYSVWGTAQIHSGALKKGFTVREVVVHYRARTFGKMKYNWHRTVKGFVDMVSVWFWNIPESDLILGGELFLFHGRLQAAR